MKEENTHPARKYDVAIVIVYILLLISIYIPGCYDVASIVAGVFMISFFDISVRKTPEDKRKLRLWALSYGFSFAVALLCALKLIGILSRKTFEVDALGMVLAGMCLTSICCLLSRR